ncbi:hypothetical protein [Idiomarina sp.]|uniref:hypothetical protein n=1 Tax=Idiomarina sp. TaxID=1874361 RepID=UPI0025BEB0E6|nr:hypothetical protein [Idiomarina sp.]
MASDRIEDFLNSKMFKDCITKGSKKLVDCCKCRKTNTIAGNTSETCKLNPNDTGDCIKFFTCPEFGCGHVCCIERGGPKLQNKKKLRNKNTF